MKVAVIGGGLFGLTTALILKRRNQCDVDVYDPAPLSGASFVNHRRLHRGYHYPRSTETALDALRGLATFRLLFPEAVVEQRKFYAIAKEGSRVSSEQYETFCRDLGLELRSAWPALHMLAHHLVQACWDVPEPRLAWEPLTRALAPVAIVKDAVRTLARLQNDAYVVNHQYYDAVVNATYANLNSVNALLGLSPHIMRFEDVVLARVVMDAPVIGITIMDGSFAGLMPGDQGDMLVYHVQASRVTEPGRPTLDVAAKVVRESEEWFPCLRDARLVGAWRTTRILDVASDDRRLTLVEERLPNYFNIVAGKLATCVNAAYRVARALEAR